MSERYLFTLFASISSFTLKYTDNIGYLHMGLS